MIRLAIIGTNWITERFVQAAIETQLFQLTAVYSRTHERALEFAAPFNSNTTCFTDLTKMANSDDFDAIYIASPNALHYEQSLLMMQHGKHVICEKPIASNMKQAEHLFQVAQQQGVILFEAFKTAYLPDFITLFESLGKIGKIHKVLLNFCQYSSRYQRYLDGDNPNTFNPAFSNGSIMDIGFYCMSFATELFGRPDCIHASANLLASGVDAHGTVLMEYPDFDLTVWHSKVSNSAIPSEIQGENGSIIVHHLSECDRIELKMRTATGDKAETSLIQASSSEPQLQNSMAYEARYFAKQIQQGALCEKAKQRTLLVSELITEVRKQTGVSFPADS